MKHSLGLEPREYLLEQSTITNASMVMASPAKGVAVARGEIVKHCNFMPVISQNLAHV